MNSMLSFVLCTLKGSVCICFQANNRITVILIIELSMFLCYVYFCAAPLHFASLSIYNPLTLILIARSPCALKMSGSCLSGHSTNSWTI